MLTPCISSATVTPPLPSQSPVQAEDAEPPAAGRTAKTSASARAFPTVVPRTLLARVNHGLPPQQCNGRCRVAGISRRDLSATGGTETALNARLCGTAHLGQGAPARACRRFASQTCQDRAARARRPQRLAGAKQRLDRRLPSIGGARNNARRGDAASHAQRYDSPPRCACRSPCLFRLAIASQASGHGVRLPFDQWGGFSAATARCQRVIARAADAVRQRRRGRRGAPAAAPSWRDRSAIRTRRRRSSKRARRSSPGRDRRRLQRARGRSTCSTLGLFDLKADVINFCRRWETAAASAVFGPLPVRFRGAARLRRSRGRRDRCRHELRLPHPPPVHGPHRRLALEAPNRTGLLDIAARRMTSADDELVARLSARCGAAQFAALYGRSPRDVRHRIGRARRLHRRAALHPGRDCCARRAVCGNGIVELPEDCDDGNTADGDACPATCGSRLTQRADATRRVVSRRGGRVAVGCGDGSTSGRSGRGVKRQSHADLLGDRDVVGIGQRDA